MGVDWRDRLKAEVSPHHEVQFTVMASQKSQKKSLKIENVAETNLQKHSPVFECHRHRVVTKCCCSERLKEEHRQFNNPPATPQPRTDQSIELSIDSIRIGIRTVWWNLDDICSH